MELSLGARRRSLAAVLVSVTIAGIAFGMVTPLISLALNRQGVDTAVIGLNTATTSLAILSLGPFVPRLAARLGVLGSLYLGAAIIVGVLLAFPAWPDLGVWFALRFLYGFGIALNWIVSETWVNAIAPERSRGRIIAIYGTLFVSGLAAGPVVIGLIGDQGWPPFLVGAALGAVAAAPLGLARGVAPRLPARATGGVARSVRAHPIVMAAALLGAMSDMSANALLPLYGLRVGFAEQTAVLLLTAYLVGGIALQIPLGWAADRLGRERMLFLCATLATLAPLSMALGASAGTAVIWPLVLVWGGATFGLYTMGLTLVGQRSPPERLAAANAAFVMSYETGSVSGPSLAGAAMALWPPHGYPAVLAAVGALFLVAAGARALGRRVPPFTPRRGSPRP
ncbi:MAG: MFS transporter [Alphaproteobacteria bacterium]